jgi:hypothetical protein
MVLFLVFILDNFVCIHLKNPEQKFSRQFFFWVLGHFFQGIEKILEKYKNA